MVRPISLGLIIGIASTLACRDPGAAAPSAVAPGITGTWAADLPGNMLVTLTLRDESGRITGTGFVAVLTVPGMTPLTVSGQRLDAELTLSMADQMGGAVTFVGEAQGQVLVGLLSGLHFTSVRATFTSR